MGDIYDEHMDWMPEAEAAEARDEWECGFGIPFFIPENIDKMPVCGDDVTPISKLTNLQKRDKKIKEPPF